MLAFDIWCLIARSTALLAATLLLGCGQSVPRSIDGGGSGGSAWVRSDGSDLGNADFPGTAGADGDASDTEADAAPDEPFGDRTDQDAHVEGPSIDVPPSDGALSDLGPADKARFTEFIIPLVIVPGLGRESRPGAIIVGPDGNFWITDINSFHRMTPEGVFTTFTAAETPEGMVNGPDGNIWFTTRSNIGRLTMDGKSRLFAQTGTMFGSPSALTVGSDHNLWFCDYDRVGFITVSGQVTEFSLPTPNSYAGGMTKGPDGNLWFIEALPARIGRITLAGTITEFATGPVSARADGPYAVHISGLVNGPDGNLWFTEPSDGRIGYVDMMGNVSTFPFNTPNYGFGLFVGPDRNFWFAGPEHDKFGRINPDGTVTTIQVPDFALFSLGAVAIGPDRALWFVAQDLTSTLGMPGKVVRYQP